MSSILWLSANRLGDSLLEEALARALPVTSVITLNDDARTVMYDGVPAEAWNRFGLPVQTVFRLNEEAECLRRGSPDLVVMCGWRQVLDASLLEIPRLGFVGFHPTLLPWGRGPAPIINTILQGVVESGISLYHVTPGLDEGDIVAQERFSIGSNDHAGDVYEKVIQAGRKLVPFLADVLEGTSPRTPQDSAHAQTFERPTLADNRLDPKRESMEEMYRKIRALSHPYRGAYLEAGGQRLRIWRANLEEC